MNNSYFDGCVLGLLAYNILGGLISVVSFGLLTPWANVMIKEYEVVHTKTHLYRNWWKFIYALDKMAFTHSDHTGNLWFLVELKIKTMECGTYTLRKLKELSELFFSI